MQQMMCAHMYVGTMDLNISQRGGKWNGCKCASPVLRSPWAESVAAGPLSLPPLSDAAPYPVTHVTPSPKIEEEYGIALKHHHNRVLCLEYWVEQLKYYFTHVQIGNHTKYVPHSIVTQHTMNNSYWMLVWTWVKKCALYSSSMSQTGHSRAIQRSLPYTCAVSSCIIFSCSADIILFHLCECVSG